MRQLLCAAIVASAITSGAQAPVGSYLFVWAGDKDRKASDFLGVIDANPDSPKYGTIVASLPVGLALLPTDKEAPSLYNHVPNARAMVDHDTTAYHFNFGIYYCEGQ